MVRALAAVLFHAKARVRFSAGCLADIQDFIKQLMDARKNGNTPDS
jgi:hypothetical protein